MTQQDYRTRRFAASGAQPTVLGHRLLEKHYMYRIYTKVPPQRLVRVSFLTYLGWNEERQVHQFNARPYAGTQQISDADIIRIEPVRPGSGRENGAHYMDRVVRDA